MREVLKISYHPELDNVKIIADLGLEMYDVIWNIFDLANKLGIDLEKSAQKKMDINESRVWQRMLISTNILDLSAGAPSSFPSAEGTSLPGVGLGMVHETMETGSIHTSNNEQHRLSPLPESLFTVDGAGG